MENKRPWSTRNYIELDFFAGAPNPRWELSDQDARQLMTAITRGERRGPGETFVEADSGYGGAILHVAEPSGPGRYFTIFNEQVFDSSGDVVLNDAGRAVERLLFARAPDEAAALIDQLAFDEAVALADSEDEVEAPVVVTGAARAVPNCPQAPAFEVAPPPVRWNRSPGRDDNNCYNYANNVFSTIDDALPGGVLRHQWTELEMHRLLVGDGLVPVNPADRMEMPMVCSTAAQAHLVAVYLRRRRGSRTENGASVPNFTDFHCYRLDRGAVWSHKDGRKRTSQNAKSGRLVDITTARFTLKHTLVGFYWTFPGPHRKIRTP